MIILNSPNNIVNTVIIYDKIKYRKLDKLLENAKDADVLAEAGKLDLYYETLLNAAKGTEKWNVIYDEFSSKLDKLEEKLYLSTEFDVWSMLYEYLDRQIKLL